MPNGMTGFGRGSADSDLGAITVELKSVNNRFLKVASRLPDVFAEYETEIEGRIRGSLARGSVYCNVSLERGARESGYRLNESVLREWFPRLQALAAELKTEAPSLAELLAMDGVVLEERSELEANQAHKTALMTALDAALAQLAGMRGKEGEALAADLSPRVQKVAALAKQVEQRAPQVVLEYRDKLKARLDKLLADSGTALEPETMAREAAYFADRADITEEVTRLEHHCTQFLQGMAGKGEVGRKLDFIAQEMLRETNTIASKANDAQLASIAVEMKSELERIKEQVQNLE